MEVIYENKTNEIRLIISNLVIILVFGIPMIRLKNMFLPLLTIVLFSTTIIFVLVIRVLIRSKIYFSDNGIKIVDVNKEIQIPKEIIRSINKVRLTFNNYNRYIDILGICTTRIPYAKIESKRGILVSIYNLFEILLQKVNLTDYVEMQSMFTQNKELSGCDITIPQTFDYKLLMKKFKEYFPEKVTDKIVVKKQKINFNNISLKKVLK